jgi:pimeloyl-ACP methyl ester carboxylesterase
MLFFFFLNQHDSFLKPLRIILIKIGKDWSEKGMEIKKIEMKNLTMSYWDMGKGKPLVLLHGFCGSSRYWEKVIPELSKNYRVIAPDLPGHGNSTILEENYKIEDIADLVKNLLDELNIHQVTMFGHSLGGYITLAFAEKDSERLNGFSLIHSTAFPDSDEAKQGRVASAEKVRKEGIHSLIDGLVPKLFSPDTSDEKSFETVKEIGYKTSPTGAISTLMAMKDRTDRNSVLEGTQLPVLLIAGEKDQIIPSEKTFSVSKSNIKHSLINDSGHMSMYENPKVLISEIKKYLANI